MNSTRNLRAWATFAFNGWRTHDFPVPDHPLDAQAIRRLGLAGLIYRALERAGDTRAAEFRADYRHVATSAFLRLATAGRIRDLFAANDIPIVLLKGAAFLIRFAPDDLGIRPMHDIDWLVPADRFLDAVRLLQQQGFVRTAPDLQTSASANFAQSYLRRGLPVDTELDLHRALAQWPLHRRLVPQMMAHGESVGGWRLPAAIDALALAGIHRARHAFVWSCGDLIDARLLVATIDDPTWSECLARLRRVDALGAVYATLRQAIDALGGDSERDRYRLATLAEALRPSQRHTLDRLAAVGAAFAPPLEFERPLTRYFVVNPAVTGAWWSSVVAATAHLPLRAIDEWRSTTDRSLSRRIVRIWHHAIGGSRRARATAASESASFDAGIEAVGPSSARKPRRQTRPQSW